MALQVPSFDHPENRKLFFNQAAAVSISDLNILSSWGSSIRGELVQSRNAKLLIPYGAFLHQYQMDGRRFEFSDSCLFIPEEVGRVHLHSSVCAAVVISFSPATLLPVAQAMAGSGGLDVDLHAVLQRPAILDRQQDCRCDKVQQQLFEALSFIDRSLRLGGGLNRLLPFDDLIRRLIVLLFLPELFQPTAPAPQQDVPFVHAELLEWMLEHLDEPISLTEIEQRSHYSRRSLQYAFRQRFGCGPMQWLRQQRLNKAKAMLEARQADSIAAVAQACGYLHQSSFSRDYRSRFGVTPSQTWRR